MENFIMIKTVTVAWSSLLPFSVSPLQPNWPCSWSTPGMLPLQVLCAWCSSSTPLEQPGSCHHLLFSNITFPERPTVATLFKIGRSIPSLSPIILPLFFSYDTYRHLQSIELTDAVCSYFSPDPGIQAPQRQGWVFCSLTPTLFNEDL